MNKAISKFCNHISVFFAFISLFVLTRQSSFESLSVILIPSTSIYLMFSLASGIINIQKRYYIYFLYILLSFSLFIGIFQFEIDFGRIVRFFLILCVINIGFFLKPNENVFKISILLVTFQAILVLLLSLFCFFYNDSSVLFNSLFRGSIYESNGIWIVQLLGNALIPLFTLIIGIEYFFYNCKVFHMIFWLVVTLLAGNITYLLVVLPIYLLFYLRNINVKKILILSFLIALVSPYLFFYINNRIIGKMHRNIPLRQEQIYVLMKDFFDKPISMIIGNGLGNRISYSGRYRKYESQNYYEFQTLYILNQLGFILFLLFMFLNLGLAYKTLLFKSFICYLGYLVLSSTNPYIFDLNHFWAIIILKNYDYYKFKRSLKELYE